MHPLRLIILSLFALLYTACHLDNTDVKPYLTPEDRDSLQSLSLELRNKGKACRERSEFSEALTYQTQALDYSLQIEDTIGIVQDHNQMGTTFRRLGHLEQALHHHYIALGYAEAYHEDTSQVALKNIVVSCNGLGNVQLSLGDYDSAERYFLRALEGEAKLNSKLGLAINYANLGSILEHRAALDSALYYYQQSMEMNLQLGSTVGQSLCHVHFGRIYEKLDSVQLAEQEFRKALSLMIDDEDRWHTFESMSALCANLIKQRRYDEAHQYADQLIETAQHLHSYENLREGYLLHAQLSEQTGNTKEALEYYKISKSWSDSISNPLQDNKLREICIQYEIQSSRRQVEELQNAYEANERIHVIVNYVEFFLVLALLIAIALLLYASRSRKQRIEALNRLETMRTTFFRNLTHEFRTPLTVIMGLADQMKTEEVQPEQRQHLLNSISQQGNTLLNLVNQLLSISKMMAGFEQCEWRHGDVVAFLRMVMSGYTDYARMRNIELRFTATPESITMDFVPEYYQKIVSNLLGNAFKYTPSGGSITMSLSTRSGHLMLDILDTGEGISAEDLPHVFELFYQGHSSSKQGSTGIGLPYVQQMVRQMGGIITADANLPRGTAMHIVLSSKCNDETITNIKPWTINESLQNLSRSKSHELQLSEQNEDTSLPLVMVVEDNPDISDYIALLLHGRYRVLKASDAYDALRQVGTQLPDIILTDLMMPGMDGYELCHAIRQSPVLSDVPIVIISARSEDKDRVRGYEDGADGYLLKPFNPAELFALITRLLSQRRQARLHMRQLIADSKPIVPEDKAELSAEEEDQVFLNQLSAVVNEQMLEGDLQIDTIASLLCVSRSTLSRRIKEITSCSPAAYILQLRLSHACQLLRETQLSIGEVGISCGFDDISYFSRVFRQNLETTPSQYRLDARGKSNG